jgi:hypothetical protein
VLAHGQWQGHQIVPAEWLNNSLRRLFVVPDLDLSVTIAAGDYNDRGIGRTVNGVFRRVVAAVRE